MKFRYSRDETPPALMLPVVVRSIESRRRKTVAAKSDTGADMSAIPVWLREELRLAPRGRIKVEGAVGRDVATCPTFFVSISVERLVSIDLEVISLRQRDYLLIGRDFLNSVVLRADGPALEFDLTT